MLSTISSSDLISLSTISVLFNLILLWSIVVITAGLPMFKLSALNVSPVVNVAFATYTTSPFLILCPLVTLNPADQVVICTLDTSA